MVIETERLYLREFRESDVAALLAYLTEPRVNCFKSERLSTLEEAGKYIDKRKTEGLSLAISLKENDELIGDVFAAKDKEDADTYGIGWHINQQFEGKGYAFEAAKGFLDYLFSKGGARRIYGYVEEDNVRSRTLCARLGMRCEGCMVDFISFVKNPDGTPKYENTCIYAILKKEWNK